MSTLQRKYHGVWPVIVTPFDKHGKLDLPCYRELVQWYIDQGVHGIFALCLSSEMFVLEHEERLALVRATVEQCRGRVPVAATGSLGEDFDAHVRLSRELADLGVDAVVLTPPPFRQTEPELEEYFMRMADFVDVDLGLYECPRPTWRMLSPELVGRLARTGRFGPYKETSCKLEEIAAKVRLAEGTPLSVMQANNALFVEACRAGAPGTIGVVVNVVPRLAATVWERVRSGEDVQDLHDLMCMAESLLMLAHPIATKYLLRLQGLEISLNTRVHTARPLGKAGRRLLAGGWRAFQHALDAALAESAITDDACV